MAAQLLGLAVTVRPGAELWDSDSWNRETVGRRIIFPATHGLPHWCCDLGRLRSQQDDLPRDLDGRREAAHLGDRHLGSGPI